MKKISELAGDDFFDVIYALTPILPLITEMEVVQSQLFDNHSEKVMKARVDLLTNRTLLKNGGNPGKNDEYKKNIEEATAIIQSEISEIFARDITKTVPLLVSKTYRSCIYETLAILEGKPVDEIKKYIGPKLTTKIYAAIKDADFKSFLSYAEESELNK